MVPDPAHSTQDPRRARWFQLIGPTRLPLLGGAGFLEIEQWYTLFALFTKSSQFAKSTFIHGEILVAVPGYPAFRPSEAVSHHNRISGRKAGGAHRCLLLGMLYACVP